MSAKNVEKKTIIIKKGEKTNNRKNNNKSPFKRDRETSNDNIINNDLNMTLPNRDLNIFKSSINSFINEIKGIKEQTISQNTKSKYFSKISNSPTAYGYNDSSYMFPFNNKKDIPLINDSNMYDNNNANTLNATKNKVVKMNSVQNVKITNRKKNNSNNNIKANVKSNSNANTIRNEKLTYNTEPIDTKYSVKINKIKDDYIDFLQKGYEDNTKQNAKLDNNNKELLKKCDDLINDNRILTSALTDRTSKLNKIIQENLMVKSELDKCILNNQKNEQKLEFYEEQFNLFKSSNDNYQKIIKELKEQNDQLNLGLTELQKKSEENLINSEEKFKIRLKEEIENTKKNMEEFYNNRKLEQNDKSEKKIQVFLEQIKNLQEKNNELINELNKKENMLDLAYKENEKLASENNLYKTQLDQYSHQIGELNTIIKHKDNIINNLKQENLNNEKNINKSSSCSMMKYDGNEYINENISKLINDNEENKMKIELLNDKIKSIDEIEKKYNEIMSGKSLTEKLAFHLSMNNVSPKNIPTHFNYNTLHDVKSTYQKNMNNKNISKTIISPKKLQLKSGIYNVKSPDIGRMRYDRNDFNKDMISKNKSNGNNLIVYSSNMNKDNKRLNNNDAVVKERIKNNFDRDIKVTKKGNKLPEKDRKQNEIVSPLANKPKIVEVKITPMKGRYYHRIEEQNNNNNNYEQNGKQVVHGKEYEIEKDEVKNTIREMNRKKNYTHKPKNFNHSLEQMENEQKNGEQLVSLAIKEEEEKAMQQNTLYLYGIDRNDNLHIFDVNNKRWEEMKKIPDLEDKSETFKKDYQYEGTLLYNTLYGVYILTGEKTDTLYYYNSQTKCITKICKFNYCHDNGSIMYDTYNDCLFVFGGKKITSCEYYSFRDKKVYKLPDLITDRANASFIVSNNKIYGFFGFSYSKNNYAKTIEYMDYIKRDRWIELNNINYLKNDISFDTESVSTLYFRQNPDQILIYCGIQGDEEDFVTEYYLLYDAKNNSMDKISKWNMQQYKNIGKRWKNYNFKKNDPKGFHFAKNTRFLLLPKGSYEGYNDRDPIDIMIDYKNNVHYILQEKQKIDVYRSDI